MSFPWLLPYKPFIHTPEISLSTKRCGTLWEPDPTPTEHGTATRHSENT